MFVQNFKRCYEQNFGKDKNVHDVTETDVVEDLLPFLGRQSCFPKDHSKAAKLAFSRSHLVENEWEVRPQEGLTNPTVTPSNTIPY